MIKPCIVCSKEVKRIPSRFISKNVVCSRQCQKLFLSKLRKGKDNPNWKKDVGYSGLHIWVKRNKQSTNICDMCNEPKKTLDLANISQKYMRDLSDWEWLCRKCHMKKDGRLSKLLVRNKERSESRNKTLVKQCPFCKRMFSPNVSLPSRYRLGKWKKAKFCSKVCAHNSLRKKA